MAYGFRASEADVCSRPRPPKPLPQQRALRGVDARQVAPLPVRVHISPHKLTRLPSVLLGPGPTGFGPNCAFQTFTTASSLSIQFMQWLAGVPVRAPGDDCRGTR